MSDRSGFWPRLRATRMGGVVVLYVGTAWLVLQVIDVVAEPLAFPSWVAPVAIVLLAIGLLVVLATAWVQGRPAAGRGGDEGAGEGDDEGDHAAARPDVPGAWDLAIGDLARSVRHGRFPHLTWGRAIGGGVAAFTLLLCGALLGRYFAGPEPVTRVADMPGAAPAIVVLPFTTVGADSTWREGFMHLLSTSLDGAAGIRAIDPRTVLAAQAREGSGTDGLDESLALARSLRARHAVLGSVVGNDGQLVVSCEVYDVDSGSSVGQTRASGPESDALPLANRLSLDVLQAVLPPGELGRPVDLRRVTTSSFDAFKAFLDGEARMRGARFDDAARAYERATSVDSTFALAWWRLGQARGWLASTSEGERNIPLERALDLEESLPARQRLYVRAANGIRTFSTGAVDSLRAAVARNPADAEAWYYLGESLFHLATIGLWDPAEADGAFRSAQRLDPEFAPYQLHRVHIAFQIFADSAAMVDATESYGRLAPTSTTTRYARLALGIVLGDSASRVAAIDSVASLGFQRAAPVLAYLNHPRFWPARERTLEALRGDAIMEGRAELETQLHLAREENRGRIDGRLAFADRPDAPPLAPCFLLVGAFTIDGVMLPDEVLDPRLSFEPISRLPRSSPMIVTAYACGAMYARLKGRTDEVEAFEREITGALARLDSLSPDFAANMRAIHEILDIRADWLLGHEERALERSLELDSRLRTSGRLFPDFSNSETGEYLLAAGRAREAIPYFLPTSTKPLSQYQLGKAYEQLGELGRARDAYAYFLQWMSDASPPFEPLIEHARDALARIETELD